MYMYVYQGVDDDDDEDDDDDDHDEDDNYWNDCNDCNRRMCTTQACRDMRGLLTRRMSSFTTTTVRCSGKDE